MINRRLIRIKVFKVLYSTVISGEESLQSAEKELLYSCSKTLDLYYFMLNLSVALKRAADNKIDSGLRKFQPTFEEAYPNRKFSNNLFIKKLLGNKDFEKHCMKNGLLWSEESLAIFVRKLFNKISTEEYYKEYMSSKSSSYKEDCDFLMKIYEQELEDNDDLASILEDSSLYWIDDLGFALNAVIKTLSSSKEKVPLKFPQVFMKDDDKDYAIELLDFALIHYNKYYDLVVKNVANWDSDRLVTTDITLIITGIAEAVKFPTIPIKVTINEYVEISKFYSTPNSKVFVNGLLDKIVQSMLASGEIVKSGRGLIES